MSKKNDSVLRFYNEILGLERLHYGMWEKDDELTIDKLKEAQIRYENFLIEKLPEGVKSVLDVGCGTGILAKNILEKGYAVEGLSPDDNQQKNFTENIKAPFHHMRFEKFEQKDKFDCLIMSESSQYIKKGKLFENAKNALKKDGYLMICDYFVYEKDGSTLSKSGHKYSKFMEMAKEGGFNLLEEIDITDSILNTLRIGSDFLEKAQLTVDIFTQRTRTKHPRKSKFVMWLFRKKIDKLMQQKELLDTKAFKEHKSYRFLLFKVDK